jgi:hypothetical protein
MHTTVIICLVGIAADPVDVIVDKDRAAVVKHNCQRVLYSIRLESSGVSIVNNSACSEQSHLSALQARPGENYRGTILSDIAIHPKVPKR